MSRSTASRAATFSRRSLAVLGGAALAVTAAAVPALAATQAPHATSGGFTVSQARLLDTRTANAGGPNAGAVDGFTQVEVGSGVPTGSTVELTVTTTDSAGGGYVTVYPDNGTATVAPATSNLNFTAGVTSSSTVDVLVPASGEVDFKVTNSTQLIVDQQGYFAASALAGIAPQRLTDSRKDANLGKEGLQSGTVTLKTPATAGTGVLALNVTTVGATGPGNVVAYSGGTAPGSSSVNYDKGTISTNLVYVTPSNGTVSFTVHGAPTDLVVDLDADAPAGSTFTAATGARIADSRMPTGLPKGPLKGTYTISLTAAEVPAGTSAVALNLTATGATGVGYVVAYPAGTANPGTSELQFTQGLTTAQTVVVPVGTNNQVTLFVGGTGPTQLIVDYEGAVGASS